MDLMRNAIYIWNLFLDTTPREMGRAIFRLILIFNRGFLSFLNCLWMSLSDIFSELDKSRGFITFSALIHASFLSLLWTLPKTWDFYSDGIQDNIEFVYLDMEFVSDQGLSALRPIVNPDGVWIKDDDELEELPISDAQRQAREILSRLDRLKKIRSTQETPELRDSRSFSSQKKKSILEERRVDWRDDVFGRLSDELNIPIDDVQEDLKKALSQYLHTYNRNFQSCYEDQLLVDDSVRGQVAMTVHFSQTGKAQLAQVDFQGEGTVHSIHDLSECLRKVALTLELDHSLKSAFGHRVAYYLQLMR